MKHNNNNTTTTTTTTYYYYYLLLLLLLLLPTTTTTTTNNNNNSSSNKISARTSNNYLKNGQLKNCFQTNLQTNFQTIGNLQALIQHVTIFLQFYKTS